MSDKTEQLQKKKNVKELNVYTEALEKRLRYLEDIFKAEKIDPKQVEDNLKAESENIVKFAKLEKRLNSIDKKMKKVESLNPEKKIKSANFSEEMCKMH